jgi:hypothetical protein
MFRNVTERLMFYEVFEYSPAVYIMYQQFFQIGQCFVRPMNVVVFLLYIGKIKLKDFLEIVLAWKASE